MKNFFDSKNRKITLDVSLITKTKKQLGFNGIKNINKYLKNLVKTEIYENNKLLISIFYEDTKNDNKISIINSLTFSDFSEDFNNLRKQSNNAPESDETDEIEEANSDDFDNDDE